MIREATIKDSAAIQSICEKDLGHGCDEALVKMRLSKLDKDRECVFVAVRDDTIAGFIHVEKYEVLYFQTAANILGLAVAGDFRRIGVGRELLLAAEAWAKSKGASFMRVNSGGMRKEAHIFYRNCGYDNEKEQVRFLKRI